MTEKSNLLERLRVNTFIVCDVVKTPTGVRADLYPVNLQAYFSTRQAIDLTERELRLILDGVERARKDLKS